MKGKITFEGKPLVGGGAISLMPLANEPGMCAGGEIAEDGTYSLSTYAPGDGSRLGEFRVLILQVTEKEPVNTGDGTKAQKAAFVVPMEDRIPAKYASATESPLKMTVDAVNPNEKNFDLTRK